MSSLLMGRLRGPAAGQRRSSQAAGQQGGRAAGRGGPVAVHASVTPWGAPQRTKSVAEVQLKQLSTRLAQAIAAEDYATAAGLRDEIKKVEASDPVASAKARLEEAVRQENWEEAARLRDVLAELQPPPLPFECPPCTSSTLTNGIRVEVQSFYVPAQSYPQGNQFLFVYSIRISNEGSSTVQLKRRYWLITDAAWGTQEVRGPGVVGEQPVLEPGQSFEYQSACPLRTPLGSMEGHFEFVTRMPAEEGEGGEYEDRWGAPFNADIGRFGLNSDEKF